MISLEAVHREPEEVTATGARGESSFFMKIDPVAVTELISSYLRELNRTKGTGGILLGLSGGIDSAVMAVLAVRAVGADRVRTFHLYDSDSQPRFREYAANLAHSLNIHLAHISQVGPIELSVS